MDKTCLLSEASVLYTTKFTKVHAERPKKRGRKPKQYHPVFEKEKQLNSIIQRILHDEIASIVCQEGSRLAHTYCLPKTHTKKT